MTHTRIKPKIKPEQLQLFNWATYRHQHEPHIKLKTWRVTRGLIVEQVEVLHG
jgi:hypothetical protein